MEYIRTPKWNHPIINYHVYIIVLRLHKLMNDLGYDQLSNPNRSLKLLMMRVRNHREFLQYFYYLGRGFHCISFLESISSYIKGERSHLDHTTIFEDFILYLIYNILEISWLWICKSKSKHGHLSIRCFWCLKSKDHILNHDMNQLN